MGQATEDAMLANPAIVTDGQCPRINERKAGTRSHAGLQVRAKRANCARHEFYKALIADGMRELTVQVAKDIHQVVGLEVTKADLMKMDHDRHDFT